MLVLLLLVAGCSSDARPTVKGSVTYQGAPVGNCMLTLRYQGEGADFFDHNINVKPDGTFAADAPMPANYTVIVKDPMAVLERGEKSQLTIPHKYRALATTDLTWKIERGQNHRDFELID